MNKIRELRKKCSYTQTELAALCKTTTSNVSGWECGKWQPDNDTLILLANTFGVTVDYLLGRDEITPEERAAGATETKKISLTADEFELVMAYREIGRTRGTDAQQALRGVAEKMI